MKKVLVVEDEKLIRQGIAAMIKRSGVAVEEVIECSNGIAALDVLSQQTVDVMFTDIRMPKMNGIELAQAVQDLDNPPLTVAISGYDDFSYAVEMMRHGVREYILKPVEREKLKDVLMKLDAEINHRMEDKEKTQAMDNQLLKYMLQDKDLSVEDVVLVSEKLDSEVGPEYMVVVATEDALLKTPVGITLNAVHGGNVFIVPPESIEEIENTRYMGVSEKCSGAGELKIAYEQAFLRRVEAFMQNISVVDCKLPEVPEELKKVALKLAEESAVKARVQLVGTDRDKDLKQEWNGFFIAASRGQIEPDVFLEAINVFVNEFTNIYKLKVLDELASPLKIDCLDSYREKFMSFLLQMQTKIQDDSDVDVTAAKIQEAVSYINENYATDLNMAVVSNHISMNYSLFSAEFKNYTGTNFVNYVKDLRMNEAKKLLIETDLKVNEISAKVGYDNEKHFMKSFKVYAGVSPSEYRKNAMR
ncbi:Two-component response regulator, YesN/AraC family, consists of REC and AraC-type DNA-binding domains [Pseudobutyrivibrio sp. ACV-2]|uniref:response regulator transcription factor n=1 Tax=Pseudobutyrivibrio sp. ACV-2 TaxID=1520801 RepID=UPI000899377D|nr:response regulator [Pseudobutyrivibrio sp. ACV-2]SEA82983.1 Two-component response regulator, YesN/AraC family, consists of REC and AraC-type DNA-binding domains [Pseudobutyrivibrio sp. ACV-2]